MAEATSAADLAARLEAAETLHLAAATAGSCPRCRARGVEVHLPAGVDAPAHMVRHRWYCPAAEGQRGRLAYQLRRARQAEKEPKL